MLKLVNITKDYTVADTKVHALKGISISFRSNEFVSILGPSGCGKTTLLNIIGGLDHYTSGDLYIDTISTKEFNDRDWDTYRNHRIGFIFQSYNLIPHQSILENVELALTISGMGKEERILKAKEALDKVGLKDQYNKKPNQLSGGQCQRVAIARALVNEPEILLADEPTGALDTKTSLQIMELIQEISKERLVIMVTHNPEIAQKYSTRIVSLLDGNIISDTNPYDEKAKTTTPKVIDKKSKLSFWTAFKLSARNLRSKFKRTLMVCIAGSIGIIGVASVLSVSTGVRSYIDGMQEDMLSGNPIRINEEAMNLELMMSSMDQSVQKDAIKKATEDGYINVDYMIDYLVSKSGENNSFRIKNDITEDYLAFVNNMPSEYYSTITSYYGINITNNIYTNIKLFEDNTLKNKSMSLSAIKKAYTAMLNETDIKEYSSLISTLADTFSQSVSNVDFISSQYDIISNKETSKIATEENEIMIVVDEDSGLTDLLLAQLGYYTQEEFFNVIYKAIKSPRYNPALDKGKFSYDELLNKTFTYYPNDVVFNKAKENSPFVKINPFSYNPESFSFWKNRYDLKITAILRPKKNISYGCLTSGIYYTPQFTQKVIQDNVESEIVSYFKENNIESYTSGTMANSSQEQSINFGITYLYSFEFEEKKFENVVGFVGGTSSLSALFGAMTGEKKDYYTLTLREIGGCTLPNTISIYPKDFSYKENVTSYLNTWNSSKDIEVNGKILKAEDRNDITYSDNLAVMINMINSMIDIVTIALVTFTALSLVVSTVMIAIITYVSVIERIKEIGVIRSLGGRKKDVSHLFNAETFIIGGLSGLIGIGITYLLSGIANLIVSKAANISAIAILPIPTAIIMVVISILLTSISGVIPARIASKKDPVDALRTE